MLKNGRPDPPGQRGYGTEAKDEDISAEFPLERRPTMMETKSSPHGCVGKR